MWKSTGDDWSVHRGSVMSNAMLRYFILDPKRYSLQGKTIPETFAALPMYLV
jgi:hypothetical protein